MLHSTLGPKHFVVPSTLASHEVIKQSRVYVVGNANTGVEMAGHLDIYNMWFIIIHLTLLNTVYLIWHFFVLLRKNHIPRGNTMMII